MTTTTSLSTLKQNIEGCNFRFVCSKNNENETILEKIYKSNYDDNWIDVRPENNAFPRYLEVVVRKKQLLSKEFFNALTDVHLGFRESENYRISGTSIYTDLDHEYRFHNYGIYIDKESVEQYVASLKTPYSEFKDKVDRLLSLLRQPADLEVALSIHKEHYIQNGYVRVCDILKTFALQ